MKDLCHINDSCADIHFLFVDREKGWREEMGSFVISSFPHIKMKMEAKKRSCSLTSSSHSFSFLLRISSSVFNHLPTSHRAAAEYRPPSLGFYRPSDVLFGRKKKKNKKKKEIRDEGTNVEGIRAAE